MVEQRDANDPPAFYKASYRCGCTHQGIYEKLPERCPTHKQILSAISFAPRDKK